MDTDEFKRLLERGWRRQPDGSYSRVPQPGPIVRPVETDRAEPDPLRTVARNGPRHQARTSRLARGPDRERSKVPVILVTLTAIRRRLLDPDAVAYACKPLTDAVAATLGIDDRDARVRWAWRQQETTGIEGVVVMVETL